MPMSTIELPRSMVDAVHEYAERERVSVLDLFASMLKKQYGYVMAIKVDTLPPVRHMRGRGVLSRYASSQKRARERSAWGEAIKEKYAR